MGVFGEITVGIPLSGWKLFDIMYEDDGIHLSQCILIEDGDEDEDDDTVGFNDIGTL